VFMPSYAFLRNCLKSWKSDASFRYNSDRIDTEVWRRFASSKKTVVVEPSGSQSAFEEAKFEFTDSIRRNGKALLLAVFRGKMSEGISFNDDNARAVICVGLPFPSAFDRSIKAKMDYNDEQRRFHPCQASLLPGQAWYQQQAYRAIAQALGRCIRHIGDYGTVVLLDRRHCDDGSPSNGICAAHRYLPKWMRESVRNLSMSESRFRSPNGFGNEAIHGGYSGLTRELAEFFVTAKDYAEDVLENCQTEFEEAQARISYVPAPL
jgi:fanconi anemia group J protein